VRLHRAVVLAFRCIYDAFGLFDSDASI